MILEQQTRRINETSIFFLIMRFDYLGRRWAVESTILVAADELKAILPNKINRAHEEKTKMEVKELHWKNKWRLIGRLYVVVSSKGIINNDSWILQQQFNCDFISNNLANQYFTLLFFWRRRPFRNCKTCGVQTRLMKIFIRYSYGRSRQPNF